MPKIALLLSGHTRSLEYTANNILEIIQSLNCDVFAHTWDDVEMESPTWREPGIYKERSVNLVNCFEPKLLLVEKQCVDQINSFFTRHYDSGTIIKSNSTGSKYMLYGMHRVHELMGEYEHATGIRYDIVIRYRYDLYCSDITKLKQDISNIQKRTSIMAAHNWASCLGAEFDGVIISSAEVYYRFINSIREDYDKYYYICCKYGGFIPELIIAVQMKKFCTIRSSSSCFYIVRNDNYREQVFKDNNQTLRSRVGSCISYIKFSLRHQELYKSLNNFYWHSNTGIVLRLFSYFLYLTLPGDTIRNKLSYPLLNLIIADRKLTRVAIDK